VSVELLSRARAGDEKAFGELVDPYRRELQLHCYRMLGSIQDAEDLLQETLLAAWRGLDRFEGRASLRAWLYRIATNRCLNAFRDRKRRPQEVSSMVEPPEPTRIAEPTWLEPYPDALLEGIADAAAGPAARYETRESVGLAFVAALQHLPPRQRAALVLRDALGFDTTETATMLDTSEGSVKGALQRARATLDERHPQGVLERAPLPDSAHERELVGHFAAAVERGCGVSDPLALGVILVANLNREGRIDNEAVSLAHLDLRIDRNRHCSAEVDDDVSVHRLEIAIGRILRRRHEPCGDAASGRRCLDVVVRLGNVDAAVGRLQIGRPRAARDAYATALCFGANETGGLADLNLAPGSFGNKISAGALESNVAAIGDKMRRAAD